MELKTLVALFSLVTAIAGGTVAVESRYAHHDDLVLTMTKQEYLTNLQIEQLVLKLARLQAIRNPSPEIRQEIEDTKAELERLRKFRDQR